MFICKLLFLFRAAVNLANSQLTERDTHLLELQSVTQSLTQQLQLTRKQYTDMETQFNTYKSAKEQQVRWLIATINNNLFIFFFQLAAFQAEKTKLEQEIFNLNNIIATHEAEVKKLQAEGQLHTHKIQELVLQLSEKQKGILDT